jgi:hypothetical protein
LLAGTLDAFLSSLLSRPSSFILTSSYFRPML